MNNYLREYKRRKAEGRAKAAGESMAVSGFCMACAAGVFADCETLMPFAVLMGLAIVLLGGGCYLTGKYGGKNGRH